MAPAAEMRFLCYELLTGDIHDLGEGSVFYSLRDDLWWAAFQLPAFSSWSDEECVGAAIEAVTRSGMKHSSTSRSTTPDLSATRSSVIG